MQGNHLRTIVIVGGGISGSLTAVHLSRRGVGARIVVVDPRPELGLGLAYSTRSMEHLLNVPAGKMTLLPDEPEHFLQWLRANHNSASAPDQFAPRAIFGRYMQHLLRSAKEIEHLRASAISCRLKGGKAVLTLSDGQTLAADFVVLATGNFLPAPLPGIAQEAQDSGVYRHSAWDDATYSGLTPGASVILIGSGLTAVDVWLRLRELGCRGPVTMISRHGELPQPHAAYSPLERCVIEGQPPQRARELLRHVHQAIRNGLAWRAVVDSLRARTNELWLALPSAEQRRFKRHLQRRWDVARHRMAPSIAERIGIELSAQSVQVVAGSILSVDGCGDGATLRVRSRTGKIHLWKASRVINCTGPNMNYPRAGSALLNSLFGQGDIMASPLGYGLWSNADGALRARNGSYSKILFTVGPMRQGMLLESIAVPEIRTQAADLAGLLTAAVNSLRPRDEDISQDIPRPEPVSFTGLD